MAHKARLSVWILLIFPLAMGNVLQPPSICNAEEAIHKGGERKLVAQNMNKRKKSNENRKTERIVIIGASFAAGWNPKEIAGLAVVNKGVGGEQSSEMLLRFEKDVLSLNPRAVVIWGFINDIFRSKREEIDATVSRTKQNIKEMVRVAQDNQIAAIIATELTIKGQDSWLETLASWVGRIMGKQSYQDYINRHVLAMNQWVREYAKAQGLALLDLQPLLSDAQGIRKMEYATEDGIHVSSKGYEKLTSYASGVLVDHLKTY